MRILFDENLDWRLSRFLPGHSISTVSSLKWNGLKNGQLLRKAIAAGFDVFLTVDNNLGFQQDLSAYQIAVIVLRVRRNRLDRSHRAFDGYPTEYTVCNQRSRNGD